MRRPVSRAARPAAVLAAAAMLAVPVLAGCAIGPSDRPPVAVRNAPLPPTPSSTTPARPAPLPELVPPGPGTITFSDCTDQTVNQLGDLAARDDLTYECGSLGVAASPDEPARQGIAVVQLAVLRVGTGLPLFVIGDAAGEPGRLLAARLANQVPPELLDTFALVGVDRRGTGGSEPVRCVPDTTRERLVNIDPAAAEPLADVLDAAGAAYHRCVQEIEE